MKIVVSRQALILLAILATPLLLGLLWLAALQSESLAPTRALEPSSPLPALESGPVGAEAYDRRLAEASGQNLDGRSLEAAARRAAESYEERLDALAQRLQSGKGSEGSESGGSDWRPLFAELERDHPADAGAVLEAYRQEIEKQAQFLQPLALFPEPEQPVRVAVNENVHFRRFFSLAMYIDGILAVTLEPPDAGPDSSSYLVNHCRICIPPLVAHEVAPGHHVAYAAAGRAITGEAERMAANRRQVVYHEGWALYAEELMLELGYYDGDAAAEMAAVRLLYLRALRAWIDPALHRGELTREQAVELYQDQAGLSAATAETEVARHLKDPVLKSSYFIGARQIRDLRSQVLASGVDVAEFHRRFLGRPRPVPAVAREVFGVELPPWRLAPDARQGDSPR